MIDIDLHSAPLVLLDDCRPMHRSTSSSLFHSPEYIIRANDFSELDSAFKQIDKAVEDGLYVAGWIAYEAATHFEEKLAGCIQHKAEEPLIWMIATNHKETLSAKDVETLLHNSRRGNQRKASLSVGEPEQSEQEYTEAINTVQAYIEAGDVYQINHTLPIPVSLDGDPSGLYAELRTSQPVAYGAFINTGEQHILSLSPELFLEKNGLRLTGRPMKGTAPRGRTADEDISIKEHLLKDDKSRAENLMIVDLIRNDLSRVSEPGSVSVPKLFEVEQYPTLHQMTTDVTAKARADLKPTELLAAMFPCGSVTGAPKLRAMEIIQELEAKPRGVYCGTIGHFSPKSQSTEETWCLNVPIRTLILNKEKKGRYSIGSGIVADSNAAGEYQECFLKAAFLTKDHSDFCLIETMGITGCNAVNKQLHLKRLKQSARYFDFYYDEEYIEHMVSEHLTALVDVSSNRRLRLLLNKYGEVSLSSAELTQVPSDHPLVIAISETATESGDPFLFHKTTRRALYDQASKAATILGYVDIVFFNEKGELTEGAISNIFLEKEGKLFTPHLKAGLLPGILRGKLLSSGKAAEADLTQSDLKNADAIYIGNSLRGLRKVSLSVDKWQAGSA